jgi:DNA-binding Xre family transcriptional regulator
MTLRGLWESKGLSPTEVAARAGISVNTLYRMNRRDPTVSGKNVAKVCSALDIDRSTYDKLEPDR